LLALVWKPWVVVKRRICGQGCNAMGADGKTLLALRIHPPQF